MVEPRYAPDELAHMGDAIYERDIRPRMTPDAIGRIVAIDVESGAYVVDDDQLAAVYRILDGRSNAQIWVRRVGFAWVDRVPYTRMLPDTDLHPPLH